MAHLQIGLFLAEMESPLLESEDDRAAVYLTNALTGWDPDEASGEKRTFPEFKNERLAAERVKQDRKILVVLGNPPYSGYAGMAMGEERDLSNAYRTTRHAPDPQGHGLNDLYVRFFRMAERQIVEQTEQGVVCFISNYSWLDGLSHTGMRERYVDCFDRIWIDNLNGDRYRTGKTTPDGGADPSIFSTPYNRAGIQVGTAVATLCRHAPHDDAHAVQDDAHAVHDDAHAVHYREFWGTSKRSDVHETKDLSGTDHYETLSPPVELGYPFMPRPRRHRPRPPRRTHARILRPGRAGRPHRGNGPTPDEEHAPVRPAGHATPPNRTRVQAGQHRSLLLSPDGRPLALLGTRNETARS